MGKRKDGTMGLFIGITRSGKSTPIKAMIKNPRQAKRVLVWDAKNEYGPSLGLTVIKSLEELLTTLKKAQDSGRFSYVPSGFSKQEFNAFCRLAHTWNRQKPAIIVIEELAAVTNTGKASGYWGVLVNQSLGLGATLFATVQRGQEVDKSVMNAASCLWVCQHNTDDDAKYMATKLGINIRDIPRKPLVFLMWSPSSSTLAKGYINFDTKQGSSSKPIFNLTYPTSKVININQLPKLKSHHIK